MGNRLITETVCEICGEVERREGQFDDLPKGWRNAEVCPKHVKVEKKGRGKDKTPRHRVQQGQGEASKVQDKKIPIPEPEGAKKGKIEHMGKLDANVCEPGKPTFQFCRGCSERSKCTKDGGVAIDCWDQKSRDKKLAI